MIGELNLISWLKICIDTVPKSVIFPVYNKNMEKEVKGDTSGDFQKLLMSLMAGDRNESKRVDYDAIQNDAKELLKAGEGKLGTDEAT